MGRVLFFGTAVGVQSGRDGEGGTVCDRTDSADEKGRGEPAIGMGQ